MPTSFSAAVLYTKPGRRLCGLVTPVHRTTPTSPVTGAKARPSHSRFATSIHCAPLSTPMRSTEIFVSCALVTTRKGATTPATVGYTEASRSLCALPTAWIFTYSIATVSGTIWSSRDSWFAAALDAARLVPRTCCGYWR